MNAKGQVATNASLSTLIKDYNAKVPALLKDTADKGKSIRALQSENAALKAKLKTNVFDTSFAIVAKVNDSTNKITGNAWKINDMLAKITALQTTTGGISASINNSIAVYNTGTVAPLTARVVTLEAAVKTIPKSAVSTSTSTTTTITNTILQ